MSLITIKGLLTHYKIEGKGQPVLFLHGWGANAQSFYSLQKELDEYQTITLDFPGFGETDMPTVPWGVNDFKDFIIAFLDRLGIEKCALVGHSFGGRVAILLAAGHAKRFKALILLASAGIKHRHSVQESAAGFLARMGKRIVSLPLLGKLEKPARALFYRLIRRRDYLLAQGVIKETMKKVIAQDLRPFLKKISLPTLIIWGDHDTLTPIEDAYAMQEEIPHATLRVIKDGSHYLPRKNARLLAEYIKMFLSSL